MARTDVENKCAAWAVALTEATICVNTLRLTFGMKVSMETASSVAALFLTLLLVGCSSAPKLMPTPNIYADGGSYPESNVPPGLKSNKVDLLFVTDRAPETTADGTLKYGIVRSASVGFGSAIVEIGNDLSWQELVEMSEAPSRSISPSVRVTSRNELGRFPSTPHAFLVVDGEVRDDPRVQTEYDRVASQFRWQSFGISSGARVCHCSIHGQPEEGGCSDTSLIANPVSLRSTT